MRSLFRLFTQQPLAAKVPEITAMFWVIKILTTAAGEAVSDYLSTGNKGVGALVEIGVFVAALGASFAWSPSCLATSYVDVVVMSCLRDDVGLAR